ncbi:hypothetical protein ASC82_00695 [Streptomyces sp. Root431]|nr:hypothetical protein ASC82_00695 [Streptomyces sp. Root431]
MESAGYLIGALVWGAVIAALLVTVIGSIVVVRWRRRTIAALECAELEAASWTSARSLINRQQS